MTILVGCGLVLNAAHYEVASIKPNHDSDSQFMFRIEPSGTVAATGITLRRLMMTAYGVQGFRIVGGPDWVSSRRWDLQATHEGAVSAEQVHEMLRALIEERFRLRTHAEMRNIPVYELVIDHRGARVPAPRSTEEKPSIQVASGLIQLTNATPATFASQLSYALGRPVIDKTNLEGNFDFALKWKQLPNEDGGPTTSGSPQVANPESASREDGPSVFTAIWEQLGLRLKSGRGPVMVVVIDDVQMPTPN